MTDKDLTKQKKYLSETHPEIAAQWHPTKNNNLTPNSVTAGSGKVVWWKCPQGNDHEWTAKIVKRTKGTEAKCPFCSNKKVILSNCLATTHPDIAKQWHPTQNKTTPYDVVWGSNKKVWWKCEKGIDHEWEAIIGNRTREYRNGCPVCANRKIVLSNCLATTNPAISKQWHPTKNRNTPYDISGGSRQKAWWQCEKSDDHLWEACVYKRITEEQSCPFCINQKIALSNCLATTHPDIAKQWHPTKNKMTPYEVVWGTHQKVWWQCTNGVDHEWEAQINSRAMENGVGCPMCSNKKTVLSNCLATTHPDMAKQWHPTKNKITPNDLVWGSNKKVWWKCEKGPDHEWEAPVVARAKENGTGCPICRNLKVVTSNCLATTHPHIASQWHHDKNNSTPYELSSGSNKKVWWRCETNNDHEWEAIIINRTKQNGTNCPFCNTGWTIDNIKLFIKSLLPNIAFLTPAELYVIFQQNGIVNFNSKSGSLLKAIRTGKFPQEELEKFVNGQESMVDDFIASGEQEPRNSSEFIEIEQHISESNLFEGSEDLPIIETKDILSALDNKLISNIDQEAVEFFIDSAIAKIWKHAFVDEGAALEQLNICVSGAYSAEVKNKFLAQYNGAKTLLIPKGYNFSSDKQILLPNLMQKYTAFLVKENKRVGNWSGTGAGKTLSAVLSSRVINAKLTVICCPNNVVSGWQEAIVKIYPDSIIFQKDLDIQIIDEQHQYLILNYEFFQQAGAEGRLKKFVADNKIDFIVIDEIHYSKQRVVENISKRKHVISALLSEVFQKNENLCVLGMSATPVINNLFEGKTLIELVTGISHDDLDTAPNINNCISLYQKMVLHGIRWMPRYDQTLHVKTIEVDCAAQIEEIRNSSIKGTMVELEAILTQAKLPTILENIKAKTIIYTHYLKNIIGPLQEAIENKGWKVAVYSGDDKTGLESFIRGNTDVLLATSCLATGVDGLQSVCNRIIINILPWTHAEFEQLKGRIYRQGQKENHVDIIVPLTYAYLNGNRWSWCDSKWKRIQFKKSIADAAVDGVIPEGNLRSHAQAYQDAINWLKRLDEGQLSEIERQKITLTLSDDELQVGYKKFGDFSKMNRLINSTSSAIMHNKFKMNPQQWEYYHALYREARSEWPIVPYKEAIKWCKARPHLIIGDFGCGEALLAKAVENKVYSFDHIAIDDDVIACDISHVPLEDECLDAAIFSLALMGSNYIDYLKEAYRCLKLDGHLWIAEATSRYQNLVLLENELLQIGFDIIRVFEKSNFTFLRAIKGDMK